MTLTASDVGALTAKMGYWEDAEYAFAFLVAIACFGEYIADFTKWWRRESVWARLGSMDDRKENLGKLSTLLLIVALVAETVCLFRTNQISGEVLGSLNQLSDEAFKKATAAKDDASIAITKSGQAATSAALAEQASGRATSESTEAEGTASKAMALARDTRHEADSFKHDIKSAREEALKANSQLIRMKTPRTISTEQQEQLSKALRAFAGTPFDLTVFSDEESVDLMRVLRSVLTSAGWKQQADESGIGLPETPGPFVGLTSVTGIRIEIAASRYAEWEPVIGTLVLLLKAENVEAAGNAALTGVSPRAIHIAVGKKNP